MFELATPFNHHVEPSPTLRINERVNEMWAAGKEVWHLGFGESRFPVHPKLQTALCANAHQKSYLPGQGLPELRAAIAAFYQRNLQLAATADQVIVGPGSKSLIFALQMAMQADLILPTPSWVSYAPQAELLGRAVHFVPGTMADHYTFSLEALDKTVAQVGSGPKILLINSPNNPSGQVFDAPFLEALAAYCRQHNMVVLSDEIYALVDHQQAATTSIASCYPEGTVVLGGLSKHLSLGGWRVGTALVPNTSAGMQLMQALKVIASETWSTVAAPIQYAALAAYADDAEIGAYVVECTRIHTVRTQHLWSWLVELGIDCTLPAGGFYMIANFDRWRAPLAKVGVQTSADLANYLLDEYQIATLPGVAFGIPADELSLRLATSYLDMETDAKAEAILTAWRAGITPEKLMDEHHPAMQEAIRRFSELVTMVT